MSTLARQTGELEDEEKIAFREEIVNSGLLGFEVADRVAFLRDIGLDPNNVEMKGDNRHFAHTVVFDVADRMYVGQSIALRIKFREMALERATSATLPDHAQAMSEKAATVYRSIQALNPDDRKAVQAQVLRDLADKL